MGELYRRDVGDPCSLERWDWWKHRLQELAVNVDVDAETKQHVVMALASMAAAEARPSKVEGLDREEKRKEKEKEEKEKERKEKEEKREEEGKEEK